MVEFLNTSQIFFSKGVVKGGGWVEGFGKVQNVSIFVQWMSSMGICDVGWQRGEGGTKNKIF